MKKLNTIQEIHKVYDTRGSSPILVTCDDFNNWVCKYDNSSKKLFNELIASEFAKIWGINVPETSLIQVKIEHLPTIKYNTLQPVFFSKVSFGSFFLEHSKEVDLSLIPLINEPSFQKSIKDKSDFLKIAFFDIWLANEDRNNNNFNLLLNFNSGSTTSFYAIDHCDIFNSSYLEYGITELTEDETIINTDVAKSLFKNKKKLTEIVNKLVDNFYICTLECQNRTDSIFELIPDSWKIEKEDFRNKFEHFLFSSDWKKKCEVHFRMLIQSNLYN